MSQQPEELIQLFDDDDLPRLYIQLLDDETEDPIDLSPGTTVVTQRFRERNTTTTLFEQTMEKTNGGEDGFVTWDWPDTGLDSLDAGRYEGEISISFNGEVQTVLDRLKFRLKERFADA